MMITFNIFNHLIWSMMNFNLKTYRTQDLVIQKSFQQPPFAQRSHCRFFSFAQWPPWQVPAPRSKEPPQPLEPRAPARVPTNGKIFCFWRRSTESCWLDLVGGFILDYLTIFWPYLTIWFYFPRNGMVILIDSMNVAEFYNRFRCSFPAKDRMLQIFHAANGRILND